MVFKTLTVGLLVGTRIEIRAGCRLETCETAGWKPALLGRESRIDKVSDKVSDKVLAQDRLRGQPQVLRYFRRGNSDR